MKRIKREKSVFEGSRLYRQSDEGSKVILDELSNEVLPFEPILRAISNGKDSLIILNMKDCTTQLTNVWKYATNIAERVSPYLAVPILVQAITDCYYGNTLSKSGKRPEWLGTSLKIALSLIWKNVYSNAGHSRSIIDIIDTLRVSAVLEQLNYIKEVYEIFGEGNSEFRGDGTYTTDDHLWSAYVDLKRTFKERGRLFRTLKDSTQIINLQPDQALNAVENILRGESPKSQKLFQGTIFEIIPSKEPSEFWAGLWARLRTMILSGAFRMIVTNDLFGISIFQEIGLVFPKGMNRNLLERTVNNLFWKRDWYENRVQGRPEDINNMIVERPIVRATRELDLFITSPILIADSLNWFVEESMMRYQGRGGVPISEEVFKRAISEPLRKECAKFFASITL